MAPTRRHKRRGPVASGPSAADFYRHLLSMPAHEPGATAPTYNDYLKWKGAHAI